MGRMRTAAAVAVLWPSALGALFLIDYVLAVHSDRPQWPQS